MNGSNGYPPGGYGAPPPQQNYGQPQPQGYGAPPAQSPYGAPSPQQYGAPPVYGAPSPYGQPQYPQAMGMPGMGGMVSPKNPGLAVALELLGGFFLQTFGVGHLYSGNIGLGLGLMFGYWVLTAINFALCFVLVGIITWPLTWLAFMIISSITANNAAKAANARAGLASY